MRLTAASYWAHLIALEGKAVCRVIISPSSRSVFLEQGNTLRFFARTGGGTRELNVQEALAYVAGRWQRGK